MTQIVVLPHSEYCPEGAVVEAAPGTSICEALLENNIPIEHACDMVCACTTCHVIVKEGFQSLNSPDENEEDMLDRAWGLNPQSRLSCQAIVAKQDLVIEVADNGIGIPTEHQNRVFERFFRVDKHRNRATGGSGLGLSICKHIVEAHGETIDLISTEGAGSVFTFSLKTAD